MSDIIETVTFPQRLMSLLGDEAVQMFMSWLPSGMAFQIHNVEEFETNVLKEYFNSIKWSSFTRRLKSWGFVHMDKRVDPKFNSNTFAAGLFRRDEPELCSRMKLNRGEALQSSTARQKNVFDSTLLSAPARSIAMPLVVIDPMPQAYYFNQIMMPMREPMQQLVRRITPSYPLPLETFQYGTVPAQSKPIQRQSFPPPVQQTSSCDQQPSSHVPPCIIFHGKVDDCLSDPFPQNIHPPYQYTHLMKSSRQRTPFNTVFKRSNSTPKKSPDNLYNVETNRKTECNEEAEAAVTMMNLAQSCLASQGQDV